MPNESPLLQSYYRWCFKTRKIRNINQAKYASAKCGWELVNRAFLCEKGDESRRNHHWSWFFLSACPNRLHCIERRFNHPANYSAIFVDGNRSAKHDEVFSVFCWEFLGMDEEHFWQQTSMIQLIQSCWKLHPENLMWPTRRHTLSGMPKKWLSMRKEEKCAHSVPKAISCRILRESIVSNIQNISNQLRRYFLERTCARASEYNLHSQPTSSVSALLCYPYVSLDAGVLKITSMVRQEKK